MLHKILKLHPLISVGCFAYIYLCSGLIVNFLQLLIFVFVRTFSENWGTKLNGYVQASHVAIFTFAVEWHSECNVILYCEPSDIEFINKEHALCISNHRGEVDWLLGYTLLERLNGLQGCKGLIKREAKYLPVVGWFMWFTDYLFLSRDWTKDKDTIAKTGAIWANYHPVGNSNFYILYAEGTRFTPQKHEASVKFCEARGIQPLRNVLYPRTKGAAELMAQLGDSLGCVFNVVMAFPGTNNPDTRTMFAGKSTDIDIYFRRIDAKQIHGKDREALSDFVVNQFREKDELLEYHKTHGKFPGPTMSLPRRVRSLVLFYVWGALTLLPGAVFLTYLLTNKCYTMLAVIAACYAAGGIIAQKIIAAAVISKSSKYGTDGKKLKGA